MTEMQRALQRQQLMTPCRARILLKEGADEVDEEDR